MDDKEILKYYLLDLITLLKEQAIEAKKDADEGKGNDSYNQGHLMAYYSVITLLKHQATAFKIDENVLGVADIDPEADLLGLHKRQDINIEET